MKFVKPVIAAAVAIAAVVALPGCSASPESKQIAGYAQTLPQVISSKTDVGLVGDFPKAVSSVKVLMTDKTTEPELEKTASDLTSYAKTHGGVGDPNSLSGNGTAVLLYYHGVQFTSTTPDTLIQFIYKITRNPTVKAGAAYSNGSETNPSSSPKFTDSLSVTASSLQQMVPLATYLASFPEVQQNKVAGEVATAVPVQYAIDDLQTPANIAAAKALAAVPDLDGYRIDNSSVDVDLKVKSIEKQDVERTLSSLKAQYKTSWDVTVEVDTPDTPSSN